jgi:hypothetical protein
MGVIEGDFEKGIADGAQESLDVLLRIARRMRYIGRRRTRLRFG